MSVSSNYKKQILFIAVIFFAQGFFAPSPVIARDRGGFEQVERAKNVSQLIRSNAPHFWKTMHVEAPRGPLAEYLKFQGVVAGDPHLGNFAVVPVSSLNGRRSLRFVNIDLDDAGYGPMALDFTRLMVAAKAISKDIKAEKLTKAYVDGLKGRDRTPPRPIQKALENPMADFEEKVDEYVNKRINGDSFDSSRGDVVRYRGLIRRDDLERALPGFRVLDFARRLKERGGSKDGLRLWVLVARPDRKRRILELKQKMLSGLVSYQPQKPDLEWYQDIIRVFRPQSDAADYQLVTLGTQGLFWLREKKVNLVDIDFNGLTSEEEDFAQDLAVYDAWYLGRLHGGQPGADAYLKAIERDVTRFKDLVKEVERFYLQKAIDALNSADDL